MKKLAAFALVAAALAIPAAQANAAPSATPTLAQFKALQKQVKTLQTQVKKLQKQQKELALVVGGTLELMTCQAVATTDALQGTWNVIDQIAQTAQQKTYFGAQSTLNDKGACKDFSVTRSQTVPPNLAVFSSLVALLTG